MNNITTTQTPLTHIFEFYKLLNEKDIMLVYCGEFSQDLNKILLSFTERKFKAENVEDGTRRKIFNIMVEVLQNMSKNKIDQLGDFQEITPIFMLGTSNDEYIMISSNMIRNEKIMPLRSRIDQANSLDKEGLKLLYKDIRLNSTFSETSGAGIGIIDIARKSENKLVYNFQEINKEFSLFSLLVKVSK